MQFTLVINLDNAEVADAGIDYVLPIYLQDVAVRCASGSADAGNVRDGNGNTIGRYFTNDESLSERFTTEIAASALGRNARSVAPGPASAELGRALAKMAGEVQD